MTPAPPDAALEALLDQFAPFRPVPICPEIFAFHARSLVEVWEAAEMLAGQVLPSPFWAYPWAGGQTLARTLIDRPDWVRGRRVLDLGAGGGVASIAAARAGAASVTANDIDPWAAATTRIAARRQDAAVDVLLEDLTATPDMVQRFDVLLCSELAYERRTADAQRALIRQARTAGLHVLLADSGRTYFDPAEGVEVAHRRIKVPRDLEGVDVRDARVYSLGPGACRNS